MSRTLMRGLLLLAVALALPLTLAACGSDDDGTAASTSATAASTSATAATTAAASAFPVTIEHKLGATTIESQPRRVVTLGLSDQDAVLALGVAPVAVTDWYGEYRYATWPWADRQLAATGARPTVLARGEFTGNQSYDYEQLLGLRPDLILALYGGVTRKQYETLSKIAPTVLQPKGTVDYGIAWQDAVAVTGRALGKQEEARRLVDDVDTRFAAAARDHPQFAGKTAVVAERFEEGSSFARSPTDPRSRFMTSLGFRLDPEIGRLSGERDGATISDEQIDLLDQDLLVWNMGFNPEVRRALDGLDIYQALDVVRDGRAVYVDDPLASAALTWSTVLSIPYALDRVLPQLDRAVRG